MNLNRRDFGALLASAPFAFSAHRRRPNFLVIMADDMGFSDVGCYGGEIDTPNIDRLAREGVRFTQFYNCARCCPTRASLLTGLYNHQAGVGNMIRDLGYPSYQGYLNDKCVTFAESLSLGGYRAYMSGKWHVGEERPHWPLDRGFHRYFGLISGANSYFRLDRGRMMAIDNQPYVPDSPGFYMTDAISDHAIKMIQDHDAQSGDFPFCLYLAYTAPHWPLHALEEDIAKYRGRYKDGWDQMRQERHQRQIAMGIVDSKWPLSPRYEQVPAWDSLSDAEQKGWERRMEVYAAQIDRMDQGIGRVLDSLRRTHQLENTIVFFLSDNGGCAEVKIGTGPDEQHPTDTTPGGRDSFASYQPPWANVSDTPFRYFKQYVHEGGIATPFIAWSPNYLNRKDALEHTPGHVTDIHPTLLSLAGADYPRTFRGKEINQLAGRDLWPSIQGRSNVSNRTFAWEHSGGRAYRDGEWKLVSEFRQPWSLYNLRDDRTELNDRAAIEPARLQRMVAAWLRWADQVGVVPWETLHKQGNGSEAE